MHFVVFSYQALCPALNNDKKQGSSLKVLLKKIILTRKTCFYHSVGCFKTKFVWQRGNQPIFNCYQLTWLIAWMWSLSREPNHGISLTHLALKTIK